MKALLKVVLAGLLAAALALGCRWVYLQSDDVLTGDGTEWYAAAMLEAKAMFTEKPDEVQLLTAELVTEPAESFLRDKDGRVLRLRDGVTEPVEGELAEKLEAVFSGYENGGEVLNIEVVPDAVIFYTCYRDGGCAGFLYEKELDETNYYEYLEIVENWKLFYRLKA